MLIFMFLLVFGALSSPAAPPPPRPAGRRPSWARGARHQQKQENQQTHNENQENHSPQANKSTKPRPRFIFYRKQRNPKVFQCFPSENTSTQCFFYTWGGFDFLSFRFLVYFHALVGFRRSLPSAASTLPPRETPQLGAEGARNQQKQENQQTHKENDENQSPPANKSTKPRPRFVFH